MTGAEAPQNIPNEADRKRARTPRTAAPRPGGLRDGAPSRERDARFGQLLLAPTLIVVLVVVVLPVLWTFVLAFQDLRVIDLRRRGIFGTFTLDNFTAVLTLARVLDVAAHHPAVLGGGHGRPRSGWGLAAALALRRGFRGARSCARRCSCRTWHRWWR